MRSTVKKWLWYAASLALAVAILAYLLAKQRWDHLVGRVGSVRPGWLLAAAGVAAVYWTVRVVRWRWMVGLEGQSITRRQAWISMLAGLGVGLITPMRSGEVLRSVFVPRGARLRLSGWVVVEKVFDLSAVLTLCVLGVFYLALGGGARLIGPERIPVWLLLSVPPLLVAALGAPLLLLYRPRGLWELIGRLLPGKAKKLAEARLDWNQFGVFYAYSLASAVLSVLAVFLCLRGYGQIELLAAMMLTPFVMLNNLLPATPGGFGVRELFAVSIFGAFGFSREMVFAAYVTDALIVLVGPGAIGVISAWVAGVATSLRLPNAAPPGEPG